MFLIATVSASVEYYRQVRKAQKEYLNAKGAVEDIVLSFDRELKREANRFEVVAFKVEGNSAIVESSVKRVESLERKVAPLEEQINIFLHQNKADITNSMNGILSGIAGLESKIKDIEASQETLQVKLKDFEDQIQKVTLAPESPVEPVIPIKRDKAMAALTDTEIAVLEMLSAEGSKTAPEIKERLHLSREHTARLMKKIYEEGYLEREAGRIPFRYSIKKEMGDLLKKTESSQST